MKNATFEIACITILSCIGISLFFTILPLLGWSQYSLELSLIQSGVEWVRKNSIFNLE